MKKKLLLCLSLIWMFTSCDEAILDKTDPNRLSPETFFVTGPQAVNAVNAVYSTMQGVDLWRRVYFFNHDLASGELIGTGNLGASLRQILEYTLDASSPEGNAMWRGFYRGINRANLVIQNVPRTQAEITPELRNRIIAEARFLRAFFYFELVSMYGGVPLMTEVATSSEALPRASADEVYALIISDLQAAAPALPVTYDAPNVGRVTRGAAMGMLGKVYLFRKQYALAAAEFQKVIDLGVYSLMPNYRDNFTTDNENNAESLFEVQFANTGGGPWNDAGDGVAAVTFRGIEYGFRNFFNTMPSPELLAEYEAGDPRYGFNFFSGGDFYNNGLNRIDVDETRTFWRKYQRYDTMLNDNENSDINIRVLRYADILLMMAECQNEITGPAAALPFINRVRLRPSVNMPVYPTAEYPCSNKAEMLEAIIHERMVELAGEQVRKRDMERWGIAATFLRAQGKNYLTGKHELFPIPLAEIDANNSLSNADQNPGY
jgi:hypothetical protein